MSRTTAVLGRELRAAVDSPIAYVAVAAAVVVLPVLFYLIGYPIGRVPLPGLWEGGQASLLVLFHWLPLALAFVVPALTMGTWAEERRSGTEELLLTYPLRTRDVVLGKFLASWTLVTAMLVLSVLPTAFAVDRLGDLDRGAVLVGLGGAVLLAGSYVAIAQLVSATTQEQLVAFLLGALVLGGLWALRLAVGVLPARFAEPLAYAAPSTHFLDSAARGVVDARDVVYFLLLVAFGLVLNVVAVDRRRWR